MEADLECLSCFVRQSWEAVCLATENPTTRENIMRQVLYEISEIDLTVPPPVMARGLHRTIMQESGCRDPYREVKDRFNRLATELYPRVRQLVNGAEDPFEMGIRMAIAGNVIDVGAQSCLDEDTVLCAVKEAQEISIDQDTVDTLRRLVSQADNILYLADNAGEIVFDRILIELVGPDKVTVVVKSEPILNDATCADAVAAGLSDITGVVANGTDVPGTFLEETTWDFRRLFHQADLVIAKGQGNYETLDDINRSMFFLLRAKCPVVAARMGCATGAWVIHHVAPMLEKCSDERM
jgi:uncharacterized protein with ATP-grasp and redox domains